MTINGADLEQIISGAKTLEAQIASGALQLVRDKSVLAKLASMIVDLDSRFQIMQGTKVRDTGARKTEPFEAVMGTIAE